MKGNKNNIVENGYWNPKHPRAFEEFPLHRYAENLSQSNVLCMKCQGHGGWNLSEMFKNDSRGPEWRFFRAHCTICNGLGVLHKVSDAATIRALEQCGGEHRFVDITRDQAFKLGLATYRCMSAHQCLDCGFAQSFDSGD